jgi:hypothetical protein
MMEETTEPAKPGTEPPRKKIRSEWIVAFSAVSVSILTLFVYIYQARIMMEQQHASVWPYLEWTLTSSPGTEIYLSVQNKGTGPAVVKNTELKLDGNIINHRDMVKALLGNQLDSLWHFFSIVDNRVLAPGDEIRLFHVKNDNGVTVPRIPKIFERIQYTICYCSVYGDCWTSYGLQVEKDNCE